jgi:hypothetical protein
MRLDIKMEASMDAYRSVDLLADEILESWKGAINPDDVDRLARDYEEFAPLSALGEEFELALAAELRRRAAALRIIL